MDIKIGIVILGTLVSYYLYYYFAGNYLVIKFFKIHDPAKKQVRIFLFRKLSGFIFLGIIPLISCLLLFPGNEISPFGSGVQKVSHTILITFCISGIIFGFIYLVYKILGPVKDKPQIEIKNWTPGLFLISCLGWIIYLAGYELLFRGILLMTCCAYLGIWNAIAINLAIYSAIHMVNGIGETMGALVFGLVACLLTINLGTILVPIFLHIVLAVSSDYFAIKFRSDVMFISKKSTNPITR